MFLDTFYRSINKNKEELCGDRVEVVRDDDNTIIVLADGLGSGVKANILATMTAKIVSTLLKNQLSIEEAVDTLLKTLPVCKIRDLAYSTFTLIKVDKGGNAYIIEFDNPTTIFIRDGKKRDINFIERTIEDKRVKEARINLLPGDEIYMFSDGVVHAGIGGALKLGWQWEKIVGYIEKIQKENCKSSIFEKVMQIISMCNLLYYEKPGDDSSVVGIQVKNEKKGVIMIGPPVDPVRDKEVVNLLLQDNVLKAICGGTAANIVSRELGVNIIANLDFPDPSIPPTAEIEGIDLVTEGVVTISRTLEILNKITKDTPHMADFSRKKDGASLLTNFILKECTHLKFLVGLTLNPAHREFEFMSPLIKHKVVEELVANVKGLGKKVEILYF